MADAHAFFEGVHNVKTYGASGTGSGGASADQAAFAAAATAAGDTGNIYIPPGNYYVTGPFVLGRGNTVFGHNAATTSINHTGNNLLFDATTLATDTGYRKIFQGFSITGNSGVSAKGIRMGNVFLSAMRNLEIRGYTNGANIELANTLSDTEVTTLDQIVLSDARSMLRITRGAGSASFEGLRLHGVHFLFRNANEVGIDVGPNCYLYNATFNCKFHRGETPGTGAIDIRLDNNSAIFHCFFQCLTEAWNHSSANPAISMQTTTGAYAEDNFGRWFWEADAGDIVNSFGGGALQISNAQASISGDRGDNDVSPLAHQATVQRFATTLTANRTVTLPSSGVQAGQTFKIVRTGLGAFTLNVGPGIKTIPASTAASVDVMYDGTAWRLTAYGTL